MSNQDEQPAAIIAHRSRYNGPKPERGEAGFAVEEREEGEGRFRIQSAAQVMEAGDKHREEERAFFDALVQGREWIARRTLGVRCPACGREYQEAPVIVWESDMIEADMRWDGRVYRLGPQEREHADAFHWRVWWQDDDGCNTPVSYAVTEAQVLAWTDQCGPWRRRS